MLLRGLKKIINISDMCKHKFVHKGTDSFYQSNSRYSFKYTLIDYYFCEKCLEEKEIKKEVILNDGEISYKMPDWAKTITKKVAGNE